MATLKRIWFDLNPQAAEAWQTLLVDAGLTPDRQVDYTVGIFEGDDLLATGSLSGNIIKEVAISPTAQHENLLAQIIPALLDRLDDEAITHSFVYTKPSTLKFFQSLGFKQLAATDSVVLLERGYPNFADYTKLLEESRQSGKPVAAIVMNANPVTRGHAYLIEQAAKNNAVVYVFVLSAERSMFTATERLALVKKVAARWSNVVVLPTQDYMVSSTTFPSYFLKDRADAAIATAQAGLDATLFKQRIAPILGITRRYVGEEPLSPVTAIYNQQLAATFADDIELIVVPRLTIGGSVVSATRVRAAIKHHDWAMVEQLVYPEVYTEIKERSTHEN
ncbi:[citrate (pro-3S)-lyase] ligase [Lacticaseibacillus sp. NRC_P2]|uniref:[citrate (pro-3S)-lyase] ligase n=1 Tax=Lacticaseibacillus sp. NRC_P2 TaxID=3019440 RepID=UPI00307929A8